MTAERSPWGQVTHHLLPSGPRAPAISSVPALPKHRRGAGQPGRSQGLPEGLWEQGSLRDPSRRGVRRRSGSTGESSRNSPKHTRRRKAGPRRDRGGKSDLHQAGPRCFMPRRSGTSAQAAFAHMLPSPSLRAAPSAAGTSWEEPEGLREGESRATTPVGKTVPGKRRTRDRSTTAGRRRRRLLGAGRVLPDAWSRGCQRGLAAWENSSARCSGGGSSRHNCSRVIFDVRL